MSNLTIPRSVSVLGCGWLGLPVAATLVKAGYAVKGSTTTPGKLEALENTGVQPFLIDLYQSDHIADMASFLKSEALVISFPPGIRGGRGADFLPAVRRLADEILHSPVRHVVFVSSTSVYPNTNGEVNESTTLPAGSASGQALQKAETMLLALPDKSVTILRMAGLVGYDRQPARFFVGKTGLKNGGEAVNLVHRDDCVAILQQLLEKPEVSGIFNCCSDTHPLKAHFYAEAANKMGLQPPVFDDEPSSAFKIVSNKKLKATLNYTFIYPDLSQFNWP